MLDFRHRVAVKAGPWRTASTGSSDAQRLATQPQRSSSTSPTTDSRGSADESWPLRFSLHAHQSSSTDVAAGGLLDDRSGDRSPTMRQSLTRWAAESSAPPASLPEQLLRPRARSASRNTAAHRSGSTALGVPTTAPPDSLMSRSQELRR